MAFLYPNFLYFFLALSIPILIHLFNYRRYRRISFTNVSMLKDIEIESKSVKKIRNLLILISRLLALTFLILAFSQPFLPSDSSENNNTGGIAIYIDNSFSMGSGELGNDRLEQARQLANELVDGFGERRYFIFTNDFRQSDFNELSRKDVLEEINKIDISKESRDFIQIGNRLKSIEEIADMGNINSFILSDFQRSQFPLKPLEIDSSHWLNIIQVTSELSGNISLDSCWIKNSIVSFQGADTISVSLTNYSENTLSNHPIRMYINNQQVSLSSVDVEAWSTSILDIPVETSEFGTYMGRIETVDDGLSEDNELFFSFQIDSALSIYHLGEEGLENFKAVYQPPFIYNHSSEKNVDISLIESSDVFVLDGQAELSTGLIKEIAKKVKDGAVLVLYPRDSTSRLPMNTVLEELNLEKLGKYDTTASNISALNLKSSIFRDAIEKMPDNPNLPGAYGFFNLINLQRIQKEDILSFPSNKAALRKYQVGYGCVYVFTFGLNNSVSDFTRNPLFVPVSLNMAHSVKGKDNIYSYVDEDGLISIGQSIGNTEVLHVRGANVDIIPEMRELGNDTYISLHDQIHESGNYDLYVKDKFIGHVSLNHSRRESDPKLHDDETLAELINSAGENVSIFDGSKESSQSALLSANRSKSLWKYCVILALLFFVAEVLIIKLIKT